MEELCDKIKKYKQGDIKALEEILIQMTPLVKKLCRKDSFHGIRGRYAGALYCFAKVYPEIKQ